MSISPPLTLVGTGLRSFSGLTVSGEALVTDTPITLLGFVDHKTGNIVEAQHPLYGQSIKEKIFVFPRGLGSTVGPYVLLNLRDSHTAPLAILNRESDQGTVSGCSVARIPLAYRFSQDPIKVIKTGNWVEVHLNNGQAKILVYQKKP